MAKERRYFGMTTQQVGILVGLGAFACLLFSVTGLLAMRRGLSGLFAGAAQGTPTVPPTSTIVFTPTVVLTETPTPVPYDQLIPDGWTQYKTTLIEIWLPAGFKQAAPGSVSGVAGNAVVMELALVSASNTSVYDPAVSVSYEPLTANTVDELLDLKLSNIPPEINLGERRKISINGTDAHRLMFEGLTNNNVATNDLLFIFQDGGTIWYVKYSAEITDFYEMLASFEQSVETFRIVR